MPVSQIHFTLRPGAKKEHQCTVRGRGNRIRFMPEWHYNVDKPFVIRPGKSKDIFLCNKHFEKKYILCLIPMYQRGVVSLRLYNDSLTKKITIPRRTSLQKIMHYSLIRTHNLFSNGEPNYTPLKKCTYIVYKNLK